MSIFDFLGGTNKYKKGMSAGAKPFEAVFAKQVEAYNRDRKTLNDWLKKDMEMSIKILNSIEATERERLYGLYTQTDIKELKSEYKEILIATLYTLSSESSNEFQRSFNRSVQKYIDIKTPQVFIDFSGIRKIDSINAQEAIFQSCVEYLFLGNGDSAFFEKYGESLFRHFSFNEEQKLVIWENVLHIYFAVGPLGLAEKYGFVPEVKNKEQFLSGEISILEKLFIEEKLVIPSGEEPRIIEEKEIVLRGDIECHGSLTLKNCIIFYNGDNIEGQIHVYDGATLELSHCSIVGKNNKKRKEHIKWGLESEKFLIDGSGSLIADFVYFLNCLNFESHLVGKITNSIIRYTQLPIVPDFDKESSYYKDILFLRSSYDGFELEGCLIESDEKIFDGYTEVSLINVHNVTNCTFKNLNKPLSLSWKQNDNPIIKNTIFINCRNVIDGSRDSEVIDCLFKNCSEIIKSCFDTKITQCQFFECGESILIAHYGVSIENCEFINIQNLQSDEIKNIKGCGILIFSEKKNNPITIKNCIFDGINHAKFIRYSFDRGLSVFSNKFIAYTIQDCEFKHCVTGIVDKKNYYYDTDDIVNIRIIDSTGLDKGDGGQAENPVIKEKTASGEPIGTNITEEDVGVPLYQNV
jgi:hypothetical protein